MNLLRLTVRRVDSVAFPRAPKAPPAVDVTAHDDAADYAVRLRLLAADVPGLAAGDVLQVEIVVVKAQVA